MATGRRRFRPQALRAGEGVARPRLTARLGARFETRLTLVIGGAGLGKSTALAAAAADNRRDPIGHDVWISLTEADADPAVLAAGVTEALELGPPGDWDAAVEAAADAIWSRAPTPVALILDDAHHLDPDGSLAVVASLLDRLPDNGHIVLAARTTPPLRLARLEALGLVERIGETDLLFDDDELAELARRPGQASDPPARTVPTGDLPRLPALADLQLRAGPEAGRHYLWEEVLSALPTVRLAALTDAAVLDELDDEVVGRLSHHRFDARTLTEGLPMVEVDADGRRRLHARLREALLDGVDEDRSATARQRAADVELGRGRRVAGARLLAAAGQRDQVLAVAERFAALPLMLATVPDSREMLAVVDSVAPGSLVGAMLEAQAAYGNYDRTRIDRFAALARRARRQGATGLEALAILRVAQGLEQRDDPLPDDLLRRIGILAAEDRFALAVDAHIGSARALATGDAEAANDLLRWFDGFEPTTRRIMLTERLCQLGLVDEVGHLAATQADGTVPGGGEIFEAYALWLRGDASPELALAVVDDMLTTVARRAHRYTRIALLSVGVHVALAAGEVETSRRLAERSLALDGPEIAPGIRCYAHVARASALHGCGAPVGEVEAALGEALRIMPFGRWPAVAYLQALPLVYTVRPDCREVLDRARFDPALRVAVQAGRALVALRERGDGGPAADLPWDEPNLLRAHVLPRDLVELVAAAGERAAEADLGPAEVLGAAAARTPAGVEVSELPAVAVASAAVSGVAGDRAGLGGAPPPGLTIRALGALRAEPLVGRIDEDRWRRSRVRELLAYLVEHRSASRTEVAADLWPELSGEKRATNLRVNLNHLMAALEPERPAGGASAFLVVERDRLALGPDVEVDVDGFDAELGEARRLDHEGEPAAALERYRGAAARWTGSYLDGVEAGWAFATGARLRAGIGEARSRIGELLLARGEPEEAATWAVEATRANPLDERAGRLFLSCLAAMGDRTGALAAADQLVAALSDAGLAPERATEHLIDRLRRRG